MGPWLKTHINTKQIITHIITLDNNVYKILNHNDFTKWLLEPTNYLTWLTWLRCSGLSVPLLSYGKSFSNQSYSGLDVLLLQGVVSEMLLIWSFHLSGGGGASTWSCRCEIIFVCLVWVLGVRNPGNMSKPSQLPFVDFLVMVLSIWSSRLILTFLTLSHSLTLQQWS